MLGAGGDEVGVEEIGVVAGEVAGAVEVAGEGVVAVGAGAGAATVGVGAGVAAGGEVVGAAVGASLGEAAGD